MKWLSQNVIPTLNGSEWLTPGRRKSQGYCVVRDIISLSTVMTRTTAW